MRNWDIPEDTYTYIFKKNLFLLIGKIIVELGLDPTFVGTFFGHKLKWVEGHYVLNPDFKYELIYEMFKYLLNNHLDPALALKILPIVYEHPKMDFDSVLTSIKFRKINKNDILSNIGFLKSKFQKIKISGSPENEIDWIMGQLRNMSIGNINLSELYDEVINYHN